MSCRCSRPTDARRSSRRSRKRGRTETFAKTRNIHAAREQQSFIEGRIGELEGLLSTAEIIDPGAVDGGGRVVFGATVELEHLSTGDQVKYQVVGDMEADIGQGLISISSPLARALIGKEEGSVATVVAPEGEIEYEILSVAYV